MLNRLLVLQRLIVAEASIFHGDGATVGIKHVIDGLQTDLLDAMRATLALNPHVVDGNVVPLVVALDRLSHQTFCFVLDEGR